MLLKHEKPHIKQDKYGKLLVTLPKQTKVTLTTFMNVKKANQYVTKVNKNGGLYVTS